MNYVIKKDLSISSKEEDQLGRDKFAASLSDAILKYIELEEANKSKDCLVFGLEGEWGSGKTSLIHLMENYLSDKVIVHTFNSWMTLNPDAMAVDFMQTVLSALPKNEIKSIGSDMKKYVKSALNGVNISASIKVPGTDTGISLSKTLDLKDKKGSLAERKKDLIDKLSDKRTKWIVIFVDDIDRISSAGIGTLFQLIKNIADFPKIIYVLAYDKKVVINALADVQKTDGDLYLQKIIQVSFPVPKPDQSELDDYFLALINEITKGRKSFRIDNNHFYSLYRGGISKYLKNLRDCKRVTNAFALKYALCGDDVDVGDLIAITVIELYEDKVFNEIMTHKSYMLGVTDYGTISLGPEILGPFSDHLKEKIAAEDKNALIHMIDIMFPGFWKRAKEKTQNNYGLSGGLEDYICSRESFEKYFALSIGKDEVSLEDIRQFLNAKDVGVINGYLSDWNDRKVTYDAFKKTDTMLYGFLENGTDYQMDLKRFQCFLEGFSFIKLNWEDRPLGFSNYFYLERLIGLMAHITLCNGKSDLWDYEKLKEIFSDANINLSIKGMILKRAGSGQNKTYINSSADPLERVLSENEFQEAVKLYVEIIRKTDESKLFAEHDKDFIFDVFKKEDPAGFKGFLCKSYSDENLMNRLCLFLKHSTPSDDINVKSYSICGNPSVYFDIKVSMKKMKDYMKSDLFKEKDEEWKESVAAFYLLNTQKDARGNSIQSVGSEQVLEYLGNMFE